MRTKTFWYSAFVCFFVSGCAVLDNSEGSHLLNGPAYSAISSSQVSIFLQKPNFSYTTVGIVEASGMGLTEKQDMQLAVAALKREAASIGANGVIIVQSSQDIAGISKHGTSTERRLKGIAIRY